MAHGTFQSVEAVLLDSSGDPADEIQHALDAVATFAKLECEMTLEAFQQAAERAYKNAKEPG